MFKQYQHIERFGTTAVDGIDSGDCFIFPKIDGTNGCVCVGQDLKIRAFSKKRELSLESDNAGFYTYVSQDKKLLAFFNKYPNYRLFGEWLVPHSLKTYREDAWRKFYIFDVCTLGNDGELKYMPYDLYKPLLNEFYLDHIPAIAIIENPTQKDLISIMNKNTFLIDDEKGIGEGIVIKNYEFYNRYGKQIWAKIISDEFKNRNVRNINQSTIQNTESVEQEIINNFVTTAFIEKEYAKIINDNNGWDSKLIPRLLQTVFYELINEESWNIIKKYKNPTINYKILNILVVNRIKEVKPEIF